MALSHLDAITLECSFQFFGVKYHLSRYQWLNFPKVPVETDFSFKGKLSNGNLLDVQNILL